MKTFNIQSIICTLLLMFTGTVTYSQISKVDIIATGLTCSMCSNAINKQLKSLSQVSDIDTDLNTNTFTVLFKKNEILSPKVLKDAVEKAGFFVGSMVLTIIPENVSIQNHTTTIKDISFAFMDENGSVPTKTQYRVIDKGFVTQKEYKKLSKTYSKHTSYSSENSQIYHLKAL